MVKWKVIVALGLLAPIPVIGQPSITSSSGPSAAGESYEVHQAPDVGISVDPSTGQADSNSGILESSGASAPVVQQSLSLPNRMFADKITFNFPNGTPVTTQYQSDGIIFAGSGPQAQSDGSSNTSPVLTGTPHFSAMQGDITGTFVNQSTGTPTPVSYFQFVIGHLDAPNRVKMEFFNPQGNLLFTQMNTLAGFAAYTVRGGNVGIGGWRFSLLGEDINGYGIDNLVFSVPGIIDLGSEMGVSACALGNPVNPSVGNKYQVETDYRGNKIFPLEVKRTYNSINGQWQFFPELNFAGGGVENIAVRPDGKRISYAFNGLTTPYPLQPNVTATLQTVVGDPSIGYRFTSLDKQVEEYDHAGRIIKVSNRAGVSHTYTYDTNDITVTHSLGGSVVYAIDGTGRITGFIDPENNQYTYTYGVGGLITQVSYPSGGGTRIYHYGEGGAASDLLTGITDANGDRFATWTYDADRRALSSEHGGGVDDMVFDYTNVNATPYSSTRVTNPLGKDTIYTYVTINGRREIWRVDGQQSANCVAATQQYIYNVNTFINQKVNWRGIQTSYVKNSKGQETSRTEANNVGADRRTITTQWHSTFNLPTKITEPGKETTFIYDSDGNLENKIIVDTAP